MRRQHEPWPSFSRGPDPEAAHGIEAVRVDHQYALVVLKEPRQAFFSLFCVPDAHAEGYDVVPSGEGRQGVRIEYDEAVPVRKGEEGALQYLGDYERTNGGGCCDGGDSGSRSHGSIGHGGQPYRPAVHEASPGQGDVSEIPLIAFLGPFPEYRPQVLCRYRTGDQDFRSLTCDRFFHIVHFLVPSDDLVSCSFFLAALRTLLMCLSKSPFSMNSARAYCSKVGTAQE